MRGIKNAMLMLTAGLALLALGAGVALAQAQTDTVIAKEPITFGATNPCNGEFIEFSGTFLLQGHSTYDANGNQHSSVGSAAVNVSGTGAQTGARYRYVVGGGRHIVHETLAEPFRPEIRSEVFTLNIVGSGDAPNFLMHVTVHYTYNVATGEFTAEVENVNTECRG
jgi:hypothetical protein